MGDMKMVVLCKPKSLSDRGKSDLRKAGFTVVEIKDFGDIQFRGVIGTGFADEIDDFQVMVLKAALDSFNFSDKLGRLVTDCLKARVKKADGEGKK